MHAVTSIMALASHAPVVATGRSANVVKPPKYLLMDPRLYERFSDILKARVPRRETAPQLTRRLIEMGWIVEVSDGAGGLKLVPTGRGLLGFDKQTSVRWARYGPVTFVKQCEKMLRAQEKRKRKWMNAKIKARAKANSKA